MESESEPKLQLLFTYCRRRRRTKPLPNRSEILTYCRRSKRPNPPVAVAVSITYQRRNKRPNPQLQPPTFLDNVVVGLQASSSGVQKEEGSMQELPSETLCNSDRQTIRKRKCRADSSKFEDVMPQSHVCGRRSGSLHGRLSDTYSSHPSHWRRRNALRCSNSITQEGMLDTKMFHLYFENIWSGISEEKRNSFAYLDALWFNLYTYSYKEKVLTWIKRKDIFSKKYVLVPIVMWSHWRLLILCHFGEESKSRSPCMVLLDSLQSSNQSLEPEIRKFVLDIHKKEERPANRESIKRIPLLVPKVPQQRYGEECGCYVLFYANLFLENAPESFSISDGYPYFMKEDWFTIESLDGFRYRLGSVPAKSSGLDE